MPLAHNFTASPPNLPGFFSPQTSAVNFCEIDYQFSPYIAEFINTLTNLTYIYLGLATLPRGSSILNPLTYPPTNISLLLVGVGSFVFHLTLRHTMQILDEVGMYAIVASLNYDIYTRGPRAYFASPLSKVLWAVGLLGSSGWVSWRNYVTHYHASHDLDIHTTLFVGLLTTFWPRLLYVIRNARHQDSTGTKSEREEEIFKARMSRFRTAVFSFLAGFIIWLIDGYACETLRDVRARIGLPFAWLLEFHGVWHILTAVGAGMFVTLVEEVTGDDEKQAVEGNGRIESRKAP